MTQVRYNGPGALWPHSAFLNTNTLGTTLLQMDAAAEKGALLGPVWWPDDGDTTKNLTHIGWRSGTIVFGGSSQWRLSVQGVSTTTSPMQPNGTVAEHHTAAVGVAPASNAWNRHALDTARAVTRGELLAFVWEFLTFTASDILRVAGGFTSTTLFRPFQTDTSFYGGASWASNAATPIIVLEFDDGTYGTIYGSFPFSNTAVTNFNSGTAGGSGFTAGDERGIEVAVPFPMPVEGVWGELNIANASADFDIVLYDGTTVLETISVDATSISATSQRRFILPLSAVRLLTMGSTVRLMVKPTTTNNVAIQYFTLDSGDHRALHGGMAVSGVTREDGGAFSSPVTTVVPLLGFVLAGGDDGAGGGGGGGGRGGFSQMVSATMSR